MSLVWFAVTQWARFAENHPDAGVCLGDETWRHVDNHLSAGGTVVWFCIRSQTRSVLALVLFLMRRRRGDMPLGHALQLVSRHMDQNPRFRLGLSWYRGGEDCCGEEWILKFVDRLQKDSAARRRELHENDAARAAVARVARGPEGEAEERRVRETGAGGGASAAAAASGPSKRREPQRASAAAAPSRGWAGGRDSPYQRREPHRPVLPSANRSTRAQPHPRRLRRVEYSRRAQHAAYLYCNLRRDYPRQLQRVRRCACFKAHASELARALRRFPPKTQNGVANLRGKFAVQLIRICHLRQSDAHSDPLCTRHRHAHELRRRTQRT